MSIRLTYFSILCNELWTLIKTVKFILGLFVSGLIDSHRLLGWKIWLRLRGWDWREGERVGGRERVSKFTSLTPHTSTQQAALPT